MGAVTGQPEADQIPCAGLAPLSSSIVDVLILVCTLKSATGRPSDADMERVHQHPAILIPSRAPLDPVPSTSGAMIHHVLPE